MVDAEQRQTYATYYDPSYAGELRIPIDGIKPLPVGARKVMVRRAAMELFPGAIATSVREYRRVCPRSRPKKDCSTRYS